jgi:molecular chaperone GrpE
MADRHERDEQSQSDEQAEGTEDGMNGAEVPPDPVDAAAESDASAWVEAAAPQAVDRGAGEDEIAALNDRYLRLAAEFDNFRKRTVRERTEWRERAQADLARQLLETLDDLGRVTALEARKVTVHDVIEGIHMVERKLLQELEQAGFERVGSLGEPFDPNYHEAVATQPATDEAPAGTVGTLVQPGYRLGNVLLRPARVIVTVDSEESPA